MSKYKKDDLTIYSLNRYYKMRAEVESKDIETVKLDIRNKIITELFNSKQLQERIPGMCHKNYIKYSSRIHEDVLQESFLQLSKYNIDDLFLAYCDNPDRVLGMAINITKRAGFGKMKHNISPNQSVAKQILYSSNLNSDCYIETKHGHLMMNVTKGDDIVLPFVLSDIPDHLSNDLSIWEIIKPELTKDERDFLHYLLTNFFDKKTKPTYSATQRKEYLSLTEFKLQLLMLSNKIETIIKNKKISVIRKEKPDDELESE